MTQIGTAVAPPVVDVPALYAAHWRPLLRLAVLLTGDRSVAEDVVQDAFVALHRKQSTLRHPEAALGYVRASVVNLSRMAIRRRIGERRLVLTPPLDAPGADVNAMAHEQQRAAVVALRALPDRQREVLVLRYWLDLSEAEIAATLGISAGTVKSSASRGLDTLERVLGDVR